MKALDNKAFNLFDLGLKKAGKVRLFDENALDEDGNLIDFETQVAIVSHYLQTKGTKYSKPFRDKAPKFIKLWNEWAKGRPQEYDFEDGIAAEPSALDTYLFHDIYNPPFKPVDKPKFTFIDLFAGIGGFRMALQNLGGKCVFSSEWDSQAQKTYFANYGEYPFGDITLESTKRYIPDNFDILCAGFPCQAFSLAGKRLGFAETRGTLFFDVAEILRRKQPKAVFLENVKGLAIHDKGKTLKTILNTLDEVGYVVPEPQIINAMYFGVPQHRERIYIVAFRKDLGIIPEEFTYPEQKEVTKHWIDVREAEPVPSKYYLSTTYVNTLINHKKRHEAKGHGFGYAIIPDDGIANAIVVGGMGRERNIVIDKRQTDLTPTTRIKGEYNRDGWRRMTPREWGALQGYPVYDTGDGKPVFVIPVADASAYKQFGNSVAVPAIQATADQILKTLNKNYGTQRK
jgi:DNA (cytosine-5)-methyltransferase 1